METTTVLKSPITITDTAFAELKRIVKDQEIDLSTMALRIGVKGGGCSGMSYVLGFDNPEEADTRYELDGMPIIMNKAHGMYLVGMQVDWINGLNNRGFQFNNPNASSTCGCGESFAA